MDREFKESLEEVFCDRNFILSDEKEDIEENLAMAKQIFERSQTEVQELIGNVRDGECWDDTAAIFSIQQLVFAKKYIARFEKQIRNL